MRIPYKPNIPTILFFMSLITFASCKDGKSNKDEDSDSRALAEKFNDAKFKDSKEADFMVDAAAFILQTKEMIRLAKERGKGENIKEMASMMEKDHTELETEMKELAAKKQITLPAEITEKGNNKVRKLNEKSGAEFDKHYCEILVDEHKDAIKTFEKAIDKSDDIEIKNWAIRTTPILRNHLDHAMTCDQNYKTGGRNVKKEVYNANQKNPEGSMNQDNNNQSENAPVKKRNKSGKEEEKKNEKKAK
jgi:putative membrane protein